MKTTYIGQLVNRAKLCYNKFMAALREKNARVVAERKEAAVQRAICKKAHNFPFNDKADSSAGDKYSNAFSLYYSSQIDNNMIIKKTEFCNGSKGGLTRIEIHYKGRVVFKSTQHHPVYYGQSIEWEKGAWREVFLST
ncbi:MAG: hypothetical protein GY861_02550 [bacterium]|nr:hypothetical protein [bacterium]